MPTRSATQPAPIRDSLSPGDTVIGVRPPTPEFYENLARQQSGVPPRGARDVTPQPAAPSEPALPMIGVARHHHGREIQRLTCQVEAGRRDLTQRFTWGAGGQQISSPAMLAQRAELVAQLDAIEVEIARLLQMDEQEIRAWAGQRGIL